MNLKGFYDLIINDMGNNVLA